LPCEECCKIGQCQIEIYQQFDYVKNLATQLDRKILVTQFWATFSPKLGIE
jgi:hypothetical protein